MERSDELPVDDTQATEMLYAVAIWFSFKLGPSTSSELKCSLYANG